MPKIPLGAFGNAIASTPQRVNVPAGAFDNSGAENLARTALNSIGGVIHQVRQQDEALNRAKAANAVLDHEIAVRGVSSSIEQQLADGTLNYKDAPDAYKKAISGIQRPDTKGFDPVTLENFDKGVKRAEFHGETALAGAMSRARVAENKTTAESFMDKLGKQASLPGADIAKLNEQIGGLDEVGRLAYGAGWEKRKQDWQDNNWNDHLNQRAMAARNDLKSINDLQEQITSGEYADKLDSNKRNTLVARLDGYKTSLIQRQEAAAARAERAAERHLKQAEAEFNTFTAMADKGTIIDPSYADVALQKTSGTPYQAGVQALLKQAQETGGIAAQPLRVQQAMLDQVDKQIVAQGRTPALDKRREQIEKVMRGSQSDLREDGLRAGLQRGVIADIAPVDISTPEALAKSVSARLQQAETVGLWAGKPVSPLDSREAEGLRGMLETLPAKQKAEAIATISGAVGLRMASAISEQIGEKDKALSLAFASSGSRTTNDRYTSELILKGATAIKDGTAMKDDKKVTGWKAQIATEIEGAIPNEKAATAVKEAAYFIAAGFAHENGGSVSTSDVRRAVRLAVGGSIIERNGKKLPIPAGMEPDDFEKRVGAVSQTDILKQAPDGKVRVGGVEMPVSDFTPKIGGQELMFAGPGRYAVVVKGRPVTNAAGKPIIIGVQ